MKSACTSANRDVEDGKVNYVSLKNRDEFSFCTAINLMLQYDPSAHGGLIATI